MNRCGSFDVYHHLLKYFGPNCTPACTPDLDCKWRKNGILITEQNFDYPILIYNVIRKDIDNDTDKVWLSPKTEKDSTFKNYFFNHEEF